MSGITESVDVDVPVPAAYDQWTRFESFPMFMEAVEEVTRHGDAMTHWEIDVDGARREFDARITERPGRRVAWESVGGPRHAGVVTLHELGPDETMVTLQLDTDPEGVVRDPAGAPAFFSRRAQRDLRRYKELVERRSVQGAA